MSRYERLFSAHLIHERSPSVVATRLESRSGDLVATFDRRDLAHLSGELAVATFRRDYSNKTLAFTY